MVEKRRWKRRHLVHCLEVLDRLTGQALGHLADLTSEGLMLLTQRDLAPGQRLDIEVRLPQVPGLHMEKLYLKAVVCWSGGDKNPALRCAGCRFAPVGVEDEAIIDLLFKLVAFEDA